MKSFKFLLSAFLVVAGLLYVNSLIPKPQQIDARTYDQDHGFLAQEFPCNTGSCPSSAKVIKMVVDESPSCSTGTLSSLSGYKGKASFQVENTNVQYKIHVVWGSYFCANATTGSCTSGQILSSQDIFVNPGQWVATYSPVRTESTLTCGKVQTDMSFQAYRKVGSSWVLNLSYGNLSNPGASNATYTYCNTGKVCPSPTHLGCQNNACVQLPGAGSPQCTTNPNSCAPTHLSCQNNTCTRVSGTGTDSCTPEGSTCGQIQHMACVENSCRLVPGPGQNTCSQNSDCQTPPAHLIVKKHVINDDGGTENAQNFTIFVKNANNDQILSQTAGNEDGTTIELPVGVLYSVYEGTHDGYDQTFSGDCSGMIASGETKTCTLTNNDIAHATHKACVSNACTVVTGAGSDSCNVDSDCQTAPTPTPTPFGCTSNCGDTINNNITVEQHQEQQQQQQMVLGASVAPAPTTSSLPSTGAGADVLFGLIALIPAGLKLRKFV